MIRLLKTPDTYTFNGAEFLSHSEKMITDTRLLDFLKNKAEKLMKRELPTVLDRKALAASGDPHDYCSMGIYWWPNPDTENGLPYICKDGIVNPDINQGSSFWGVFHDVYALTLAAYYLNESKYAEKAVDFIRSWYIDPETCCNPHLKYGQSIPGICDGRGIGLIDTCQSHELFDCVAILDAMGMMPSDVLNGLKAWYNEFLDWMLTSEIAIDEDRTLNNHGTWYDVQIGVTALFLNRPSLAERTLSLSYERRILKQIDSEGKQPRELARTKGMRYSLYNLHAMLLLARLAEKTQSKFDIWHAERENGSLALRSAIDYITQFSDSLEGFPYQEISGEPDQDDCVRVMLMADKYYPERRYAEKASKYFTESQIWRLVP